MSARDSNLWAVLCYAAVCLWIVTSFFVSHDMWLKLVPLNGIAHYATALSLSVIGTEWMGRRKTLLLVIGLMLAWEVFEMWWFSFLLGNRLENTRDLAYWTDMMSDLALGTAGMLTGTYLNQPSNRSDE